MSSDTAYYVSTPRFTCLVMVNDRGIITARTAPYLQRQIGVPFEELRRRLYVSYGQRQVRIEALPIPAPSQRQLTMGF